MNKIKIENFRDPFYDSFKDLYSISFPIYEQRTKEQQENAFSHTNYHLAGYEENNVFIGFVSYWEFQYFVYIEHFAINKHLRGKGYGNQILQDFITGTSKIVLLEIDPITDEVSEARLRFYKKCGFYENPYPHIHPPYRTGFEGHSLVVLTTKRPITECEYRSFNKELTDIVMAV